MPMWYDREGKPLTLAEMVSAGKFSSPEYRVIAQTTLPNGRWVSTVWVGLDMAFMRDGPPLIFETMVFTNQEDCRDLDCQRYATEAEAREGHEEMCNRWRL